MTLDKILSIGGKPGLYKLITQTRGGFVAESLLDKKRITVSLRTNVSVLSEIAMYTLEEELPLREVFLKVQEKEDGGKTSISHKDDKLKLEEYFFEVLPNYDEDRVYASDIKKVIQWYNILHENGITDFSDKKAEKSEGESTEKKPQEKKSQEMKSPDTKAVAKKSSNPKSSGKKVAQKNPAARKK
ncbi:hypothetical protein SAMN05421636_10386 [Pricia antarctica]|uniref:Uncharacterized protein n=1 Tax=Pricia antarctica TaxID=641691 RepID=A0A1G6ZSY3_9FLAO|nr:hypothetical protein SAMN05421636_10386 [Pricia antarctica]